MAAGISRTWRLAPCSLILFAIPLAQTQDAPCTALTRVPSPCSEAEKPAPDLVATLDGKPIHLSDLDEATRTEVMGLEEAVATAKQKALRREIELVLLELEAARVHVDAKRLAYDEMVRKVASPSDEEVKREITDHPDRYKRVEGRSERAASAIYERALTARAKQFFASLEQRFPVTAADLAGAPASASTVLARVGDRQIVAAQVSANIEAAGTKARLEVRQDEQAAIQRIAHDRLVAAEAARRGISADELVRLEVTSKTAPLTDDGVKKEWERYKILYGSDFASADADVRKDLAADHKEQAEKAFDGLLRKGHETSLPFEIPHDPALKIDIGRAAFTGPETAAVTLVEWGDFQCPPCGYMSKIIDEVIPAYGTRVRYVFLQFPLSIHQNAWKSAEAALAAHAQGKFFPYAHLLFANQKALDVASLKKYAAQAGLDTTKFENDLDSGTFAPDVFDEKRRGQRAGVDSTPTFFLNGVEQGPSFYTLEGMRAAIDAELAKPLTGNHAPQSH
ncbi:MAG TPA: thioredoxin domain-containing protein [Thermoanaerobaculia bacterium]|nr:thioredoxin domain-containing protein [Thermoanaerobaculia bacterium]